MFASNKISSSAGTSACVYILRFGEAKHEVDTVDRRVYYTPWGDIALKCGTLPKDVE